VDFLIELNLLCLGLGTEHWRETCQDQDTTGTAADTAGTGLNIALPYSTMALASSPCISSLTSQKNAAISRLSGVSGKYPVSQWVELETYAEAL
jgi:hypothetical protein